ncbi:MULTISPECIES: hypothetical protein [Liquorilactobacillus]|uniref:hypothetical protein n=1 Tax=Liquorilactobacillus TaxID=2767888 RepID=UPI0039EADF89
MTNNRTASFNQFVGIVKGLLMHQTISGLLVHIAVKGAVAIYALNAVPLQPFPSGSSRD